MGWDFGELARRYRRFVRHVRAARDCAGRASAGAAGETAFVLRTLLLHEYRKIHLRDPLLPTSLLPEAWAGADAHDLCRELYAAVFPASEHYLSQTVRTLAGPLPPAAPEAFSRFGGLHERAAAAIEVTK